MNRQESNNTVTGNIEQEFLEIEKLCKTEEQDRGRSERFTQNWGGSFTIICC